MNSQKTEEKDNSLVGDSPKQAPEDYQNSMDKEMAEAEMTGEYDKSESERPKPTKKQAKSKKAAGGKKKKDQSEMYSDDSGIRLGQGDRTIDQDMEEEELLQREFNMGSPSRDDEMHPSSQIESGQKIDSNGNTTADTINEHRGGSDKKNPAPKQNKGKQRSINVSTKSTKQSNIADWVSSATKLVGHKRKGDNLPTRGNGSKRLISEFDARDKK